jgi:hypothetical protein
MHPFCASLAPIASQGPGKRGYYSILAETRRVRINPGSSATDVRTRQLIFGFYVRWLKLSRSATDKTLETSFPIPIPGLRRPALPVPLHGGDDAKCEPEVVGHMQDIF